MNKRTALALLILGTSCTSPTNTPEPSVSAGPSPTPASVIGEHETARFDEVRQRGGYFYDVSDPLPAGQPGQLLRLAPRASGNVARVYRSMYLSTSVDGVTPVAVTGTIWVPQTLPPPGGFPILAWGPGFSGIGDDCALSRHPDRDYTRLLTELVADGFVVASTDWEGHGTRFPYLDTIGESATHSLLDGARAAQDLLGPAVGDRVVIAGHSVGGDAAARTLQFGPDYDHGLDIHGVVSIESVGDFEWLADTEPDPDQIGVFLLMRVVWAMSAAYPELRPEDVLTPYGVELMKTIHEDGCQPFWDLDEARVGDVQVVNLMSVESWAERFRDQTVTQAPYPVFYIMAANGNGLAANVLRAADRLCESANHVELRVYPDTDHDSVVDAAYTDYVAWLQDRLAGDAPFDGCDF